MKQQEIYPSSTAQPGGSMEYFQQPLSQQQNQLMANQPYPQQYFPTNQQQYPQQQSAFDQSQIPMAQVDPYAEAHINQCISAGFGEFFFNAADPAVAKTNIPHKLDSSKHPAVIVGTVFLFGGLGVAVGVEGLIEMGIGIGIIIFGYLVYILSALCCSDIRGFISNLKKFDDYKQTYDKMVAGRGYFAFWIECYHYKTVKTKKGTKRKKVVTHTARENFFPIESHDESGNIMGITDITKYVFISYLKRFYFVDDQSSKKFQAAYRSFVSRNKRDQYQNHSQTFMIEGHEDEVGFCMLGDSGHNEVIFYLFNILGLGLPYSCILERAVSRYEINILKRLKC